MPESFGVANIEKILIAAIDVGMTVDKLTHKDGLISLLPFFSDFKDLSTLSFEALVNEAKDLSASERMGLCETLKARFILHDATLEAKIEQGIVLGLNEGGDLVDAGFVFVKNVIEFITKVKELFAQA